MMKDSDGKGRRGHMKGRVSSHSLRGKAGFEKNLVGKNTVRLTEEQGRKAGEGIWPSDAVLESKFS